VLITFALHLPLLSFSIILLHTLFTITLHTPFTITLHILFIITLRILFVFFPLLIFLILCWSSINHLNIAIIALRSFSNYGGSLVKYYINRTTNLLDNYFALQ